MWYCRLYLCLLYSKDQMDLTILEYESFRVRVRVLSCTLSFIWPGEWTAWLNWMCAAQRCTGSAQRCTGSAWSALYWLCMVSVVLALHGQRCTGSAWSALYWLCMVSVVLALHSQRCTLCTMNVVCCSTLYWFTSSLHALHCMVSVAQRCIGSA